MITSSILLIFFGCFTWYYTSKKAVLNNSLQLEVWIQNNDKVAKLIGGIFLLLAFFISSFNFGITSGIMYWLFIISLILSLLVIITPLRKVNYKHICALFIISFLIEILL